MSETCMGEIANVYKILVGWTEGKKPLGKPSYRGEDAIKIDLKEIGCEDVGWIHLPEVRVQWLGPCENRNKSSCSIKVWDFLEYLSNCSFHMDSHPWGYFVSSVDRYSKIKMMKI
jgi:hypothetical protein